jgi:lipoyl(octanoyl) transferase
MPEKSSAADAPDSPFPPPEPPTVLFHLLGQVPFEQFAALQRRLVYELGEESRSRFPVLICEHPPLITVGRRGSRAHIRLSGEQLRWRQLAVQWVSRGGGCVLHAPGQLAIYPLIPLGRLGWTVGKYLRSLQQGLRNALESLKIPSQVGTDDWGIWGRTGQLAAIGFSVRNEIAHYGAYLNVNPSMSSYHYLETPRPPLSGRTAAEIRPRSGMSSLLAERKQGVRMSEVRAALMEHLCTAWGAPNYHILSGHPFLERTQSAIRGTNARAS